MDRKKTLLKAFQRGHLLTVKNPLYKAWMRRFIVEEVRGDVGWKGDITTDSLLRKSSPIEAWVEARERGIAAGIEEAMFLYKRNNILAVKKKNDGDRIKKGDILFKLKGKVKDILRIERSVLDLCRGCPA